MPMKLYEVWFDNDMTWVAAETPKQAAEAVAEPDVSDDLPSDLKPEVELLAQERAERIEVTNVDTEETASLWSHYLNVKDRSGPPLVLATTSDDW